MSSKAFRLPLVLTPLVLAPLVGSGLARAQPDDDSSAPLAHHEPVLPPDSQAGTAVAPGTNAPPPAVRPRAAPAVIRPVPTLATHVCFGGEPTRGDPPVFVRLSADSAGGVHQVRAVWRIQHPGKAAAAPPFILVDFPFEGAKVAATPDHLTAFEAVRLNPPPGAASASVALVLDGVEKARRPWPLYARTLASLSGSLDHPAAFVGAVQFSPKLAGGAPDPGMAEVLTALGAGTAKTLELRLIGNDGDELASDVFKLDAPAVRHADAVQSDLQAALQKAAAPDHCAAPAADTHGAG